MLLVDVYIRNSLPELRMIEARKGGVIVWPGFSTPVFEPYFDCKAILEMEVRTSWPQAVVKYWSEDFPEENLTESPRAARCQNSLCQAGDSKYECEDEE